MLRRIKLNAAVRTPQVITALRNLVTPARRACPTVSTVHGLSIEIVGFNETLQIKIAVKNNIAISTGHHAHVGLDWDGLTAVPL